MSEITDTLKQQLNALEQEKHNMKAEIYEEQRRNMKMVIIWFCFDLFDKSLKLL